MQGVTLTIAIIFILLVLTLRPAYALAAYISVLVWYPRHLVLFMGTMELSVGRIVVAVLLLRCLCDGRILSKFTWSRLDTLVAFSMVVYVVVYCITSPSMSSAIENRGGFLVDTWFAYMAVRLCITNHDGFIAFVKCIAVVLAPLAVLGVLESFEVWRPFRSFLVYSPRWDYFRNYPLRWGLARAQGPSGHVIMFGTSFILCLPLIYYLRHHKSYWSVLAYIFSGMAVVGALSSMSSGPWIMLIVAIFCLIIEKHKYLIKPLLIFFAFSCVFIAIASNRPFYHVLASYANPLGGAGWHRAKLIDCAIEHFDEWWLVGYGGKDPGWGGALGMGATDVTNEFILAGVKYGILGVIALCGVLVTAFQVLRRAYEKTTDARLKSLFWALGSTIVATAVTFMSVSFFGPPKTMFYCILGLVGASQNFAENPQHLCKGV